MNLEYLEETRKAKASMSDNRYIVITAAYDQCTDYGRSLQWLAPELRDAGLAMIEDRTDGPSPSRTWAGIVDGRTFARFAHAWSLHDAPADGPSGVVTKEHGNGAARVHTLDGMNWEVDGESPIVYVSLQIGREHPVEPASPTPKGRYEGTRSTNPSFGAWRRARALR